MEISAPLARMSGTNYDVFELYAGQIGTRSVRSFRRLFPLEVISSPGCRTKLALRQIFDEIVRWQRIDGHGNEPLAWNESQWRGFLDSLRRTVFSCKEVDEKTRTARWLEIRSILRQFGRSHCIEFLVKYCNASPSNHTEKRTAPQLRLVSNSPIPRAQTQPPATINCRGQNFSVAFLKAAPRSFSTPLSTALRSYARTEKSKYRCKKIVSGAKQFTTFLFRAESGNPQSARDELCTLFTISSPPAAREDLWEEVFLEFRDSIIKSHSVKVRDRGEKAKTLLFGLRTLWSYLVSEGFPRDVQFPRVPRNSSPPRRKRLTAVEQMRVPDRLPAVAEETVELLTRGLDPQLKKEVAHVIRATIRWFDGRRPLPTNIRDLANEVKVVHTEVLQAIRLCAEEDFLWCSQRWEDGTRLVGNASHSGAQLAELLDSPRYSIFERRRHSSQLLLQHTQVSLGNALVYVRHIRRGIVTASQGRISKLCMFHKISHDDFNAYTHPTPQLNNALAMLIGVDTGANCNPIRSAPVDCLSPLHPDKKAAATRLELGFKATSGIYWVDTLPDTPPRGSALSTPNAIRRYLEISRYLRSIAPPTVRSTLMIEPTAASAKTITQARASDTMRQFLRRHPRLRDVDATPATLRGTHLVSMESRYHDGFTIAQLLAKHNSPNTTELHYLDILTRQMEHFETIRDFHAELELIVIVGRDTDPKTLGISKMRMAHLLSPEARTGLGTSCIDSTSGIQPGTSPGLQCSAPQHCVSCRNRYVVATVENIADLMLVKDVLAKSTKAFSEASLENRTLWSAFIDVVMKKLIRAGYSALVAEAEQLLPGRNAQREAIFTYLNR